MTDIAQYEFPTELDIPASMQTGAALVLRHALIGGGMEAWEGEAIEVRSPLPLRTDTGVACRLLGGIPEQDAAAGTRAAAAASAAWSDGAGAWPMMDIGERAEYLLRFTARLRQQREALARLISWEVGKVHAEALMEVDRTLEYIEDTVEAAHTLVSGGHADSLVQEVIGRVEYMPLGVMLCVGPYNYPLYETFTNVMPALLMGNTVIIKAPLHGALLYDILHPLLADIFPPGVVNTIFGTGAAATGVMASGLLHGLAFIGRSQVADALIAAHPAPHRLHTVLGMEAKNAAVVLPDADLDNAVRECVRGALAFNGQRCAAIKLIFVHADIETAFLEAMTKAVEETRIGMPWEDVRLTPVISEQHAEWLSSLLNDAVQKGARIHNAGGGSRQHTLMAPALLHPVRPDMELWKVEQFGPLLPVTTFERIDEPLSWLTASRFGQQISLFGRDGEQLRRLQRGALRQVGRVNINSKCQRGPDHFPFTGRKDSALGTVSIEEALRQFSVPAVVASPTAGEDLALWDRLR